MINFGKQSCWQDLKEKKQQLKKDNVCNVQGSFIFFVPYNNEAELPTTSKKV